MDTYHNIRLTFPLSYIGDQIIIIIMCYSCNKKVGVHLAEPDIVVDGVVPTDPAPQVGASGHCLLIR